MSYRLQGGMWSNVFAIPCAVVDEHLRLCNPLSLKILLLLLRHPGQAADVRWIVEQLGPSSKIAPADIPDMLRYWVEAGVLTDSEEPASDPMNAQAAAYAKAADSPVSSAPVVVTEKTDAVTGQKIITTGARQKISRSDVAEMSKTDPTLFQLLREAQCVLSAPLSPVDSEILAALHIYYKMPTDVVLMLLQYCVTVGKANMHYVEKLAASWVDQDITTHERAEQEILRLTRSGEDEKVITRAFQLYGRGLTPREREFVSRWFALGLDEKLIAFACETAVDKTGKASFAYADKILTSWKAKSITTIQAAVEEQKENSGKYLPQNKSAQTGGSSINKSELDALIDKQFSD